MNIAAKMADLLRKCPFEAFQKWTSTDGIEMPIAQTNPMQPKRVTVLCVDPDTNKHTKMGHHS